MDSHNWVTKTVGAFDEIMHSEQGNLVRLDNFASISVSGLSRIWLYFCRQGGLHSPHLPPGQDARVPPWADGIWGVVNEALQPTHSSQPSPVKALQLLSSHKEKNENIFGQTSLIACKPSLGSEKGTPALEECRDKGGHELVIMGTCCSKNISKKSRH